MGRLSAAIVQVTLFEQNCTILFDDETMRGVVVDPGGDLDKIVDTLEKIGVTIDAIWLTHGHIDHAGGAMALKEKLGVEIIGPHKDDAPLLANLEKQGENYGIEGAQNCTPDRFLNEGDKVNIGRHEFEVFHCPGHSPGHVVFFDKKANFAHVGDVLFRGSVGRTDLPGGSHAALMNSIMTKLMPLGDNVTFICGHGSGSRFGEERIANPFLKQASA